MVPDSFLEYYYGKYVMLDLHGQTKEEAKISLIHTLNTLDADVKSLVIVHGYLHGTVIKKMVKDEFKHDRIAKKVTLDAARTIFLLKN